MLLMEIVKKPKIFVSTKIDEDSVNKIHAWVTKHLDGDDFDIVPKSEYHCSIIYTHEFDPTVVPEIAKDIKSDLREGLKMQRIVELDNNAIVIRLEKTDFITKRFKHYTEKFNLESEHDNFIPHLTIAYKKNDNSPLDFDFSDLKGQQVYITEEYYDYRKGSF